MLLEGRRDFDAPREAVYAALTDPELIGAAIPALESMDVADRDHWTATAKLSIAPRLRVMFEVLDRETPAHARLRAHGKNLGGGAIVDTSFDLAEEGGRTAIRYQAEVRLSGLLGRLGETALRPIAERQIERLFRAVEKRVESET